MKRLRTRPGMVLSYATSAVGATRQPHRFDEVATFVMFLGHARSGSTLLGSLLSAHPSVVIAHELDALRFVRWRFSRAQMFHLLLRKDAEFTARGRVHGANNYEYAVPDEWQGRVRELRVIGDKKSGASTRKLGEHPELLGQLRRTVAVPLRIIHTIRNPYDNIATISSRGKTLEQSVERYFERCAQLQAIIAMAGVGEISGVRHEALVADPQGTLGALCEFLGVSAEPSYLAHCASIVRDSPNRSRSQAPWTPDLIAEVQGQIDLYPFLDGYSFDA